MINQHYTLYRTHLFFLNYTRSLCNRLYYFQYILLYSVLIYASVFLIAKELFTVTPVPYFVLIIWFNFNNAVWSIHWMYTFPSHVNHSYLMVHIHISCLWLHIYIILIVWFHLYICNPKKLVLKHASAGQLVQGTT